ncbi:hypothetical protein V8F33_008871 [Rhypophila sp. PSN 637]
MFVSWCHQCDLLTDAKKEDKVKEQLELMMKLADSRLDTFNSELKTMFLDQESAAKTSIPGRRALRFERYVQVDAERTVTLPKRAAVTAHFPPDNTAKPAWGRRHQGSLQAILGDSSAGESYDKKFFVCIKQYGPLPAYNLGVPNAEYSGYYPTLEGTAVPIRGALTVAPSVA